MPTFPTGRSSIRPLLACLALGAVAGPLGACTRPTYGGFNQPPPPPPGANKQEINRKTLEAATRKPADGIDTSNKAVLDSQVVDIPRLTRETAEAPPAEYTIGPRDELMIVVEPHGSAGLPGATSTTTPTVGTSSRTGRTVVHDDGNIQVLGVGNFKAAGLTVTELSEALRKEYGKIIKDPEVLIEIQAYKSKQAYLSGQFGKPGPMNLERRTDLLQLVSMAGNPTPNANIRGAYVQRKDKEGKYRMLPVDLYALLEEGDVSQNIWIHPDDFIYIPDNSRQLVYMMGNVGRTGPLPLHKDGTLNLMQAVVESGGVRSFGVDWNRVRIIRSHSATRGEFIVVNYQQMIDGEAMPFQLRAGDIVYFANSRIGDWNEFLQIIGPSLGVIGNAMTPFVQAKVLENTLKN